MTGSLQKTTFFSNEFCKLFPEPGQAGICPGKLFGLQKIFTERPQWKISAPIYPITASSGRRPGYYQLQSGHDWDRIIPLISTNLARSGERREKTRNECSKNI